MKTYEYTWTVESVDLTNSTMMVEFVYQSHKLKLNVPIPTESTNVDRYIQTFAPTDVWSRLQDLRIQENATHLLHQSGTSTAQVLEAADLPVNPNRGWLAFSEDPEVNL